MDSLAESAARIVEIEARQDQALLALEELERRIEQVLAECCPAVAIEPEVVSPAELSPTVKAA